jgi:hypothetical protein
MKRALIVIASVGILAVTVAVESANAQVTRPYRAPPPYAGPANTPQSRGGDHFGAPPFDSPAATGGGSLGNNQFWKWKWW